jgi:type VI secretion system secreted protein VgrG
MAPSNTLDTLLHAQRQHGRLLKLAFPHDDAPAGSQLVANRLEADEGLSRDFEYTVDVLSLNPAIP